MDTAIPFYRYMARRKTSIVFDEEVWRQLKHRCIDANLEPSEYRLDSRTPLADDSHRTQLIFTLQPLKVPKGKIR